MSKIELKTVLESILIELTPIEAQALADALPSLREISGAYPDGPDGVVTSLEPVRKLLAEIAGQLETTKVVKKKVGIPYSKNPRPGSGSAV